ncbi:MAG: hypothetical protein RL757_172 [Bacteroidota bacterium]|jgi:hypothetical protein
MTIKEAILKSMHEIGRLTNSREVTDYIIGNKFYEFTGRTPEATVSAQIGDFIRNNDSRVKRIKKGTMFSYYLSKNEDKIENPLSEVKEEKNVKKEPKKSYQERDLHKLLSTFLKSKNVYAKTIFHEESSNSRDKNQTWIHPDMVGVEFLNLKEKESQNLLKTVNLTDTFKVSSYELKREINSDAELKNYFFQAVSNSSWANFGYLIALEINPQLLDEMERLNQSFGIGIIQLNANPFQTKILFPAQSRPLDFKTIDKLCKVNEKFRGFIGHIEKMIKVQEQYFNAVEKEFEVMCDDYFSESEDFEIVKYCRQHQIPIDETPIDEI